MQLTKSRNPGGERENELIRHRGALQLATFTLALPLAIAGPAVADEEAPQTSQPLRTSEILIHIDERQAPRNRTWSRFGFEIRHGLSYEHALTVGRQPVVLRVRGPLVRRGVGLGFQLRF